jgi:uncharacterized protein (DUF433 family)
MSSTLPKTSTSRYVTRDPEILDGEPIIGGTRVAVRDIVALWKSGVKPEEIPTKLFHLVTAAQAFDALGFYLDNQPEVDDYFEFFRLHPLLDVPVGLRANPLLDEVAEYVAAYRRECNAEIDVAEFEEL